jgi:hypothetical protein
MPYQNIDATLSPTDIQAVKDAFADVLKKVPFAVSLTAEERRAIVKTGPDSVSFVQNALTAAQGNPTIFPASFDVAGFQKDVALFTAMTELQTVAEQVASQFDDTRLAIGGEAMQAAIQAYKYIQTAAKATPGLKPLADQLGERFQRASKQKEAPKAAGSAPTPST